MHAECTLSGSSPKASFAVLRMRGEGLVPSTWESMRHTHTYKRICMCLYDCRDTCHNWRWETVLMLYLQFVRE